MTLKSYMQPLDDKLDYGQGTAVEALEGKSFESQPYVVLDTLRRHSRCCEPVFVSM